MSSILQAQQLYMLICLQKTITKRSVLSFTLVLGPSQVFDDVVFTQGWQKLATQLHCRSVGGASHLVSSDICDYSLCKSFCAPPLALLLVPYNSVCYNHQYTTSWLGVLESRKKGSSRSAKKCPVPAALISSYEHLGGVVTLLVTDRLLLDWDKQPK